MAVKRPPNHSGLPQEMSCQCDSKTDKSRSWQGFSP